MPLEIQPLTEPEIPEYVDLMMESFKALGIGIIMHPRPILPERRQAWIEQNIKGINDENHKYRKVVDTETGAMVAATKWRFYPEGVKKELVNALHTVPEPYSDSNEVEKPMLEWFMTNRRKYVGINPTAFLQVLVVQPGQQRRGIGNMLMKWGCDEADQLGLPTYVEATPNGKPLYEKFGFKEFGYNEFDLSKCKNGYDAKWPQWTMMRQPNTV